MNLHLLRFISLTCLLSLFFLDGTLGLSSSFAQKPSNFKSARESNVQSFPKILGADRAFAYEWWYLTAHLFNNDKKIGGLQITLFRFSPNHVQQKKDNKLLRPKNASYLVTHTAFTDLENNKFFSSEFQLKERLGLTRLSTKKLDFKLPGLKILYEDNHLKLNNDFLKGNRRATVMLELNTKKGPIFHGKEGFSKKGYCDTCASHYVSFTDLEGSATVQDESDNNSTDSFQVLAWFDHEQGTNTLSNEQVGWDWFGIRLKNGYELMLFQLRDKDQKPHFESGTIVFPDGRSKTLSAKQFELKPSDPWISSKTNAAYPQKWEIRFNGLSIEGLPSRLYVTSEKKDQEVTSEFPGFPTYWEGTCTVSGEKNRSQALGHAYLEMTGYDESRQPSF